MILKGLKDFPYFETLYLHRILRIKITRTHFTDYYVVAQTESIRTMCSKGFTFCTITVHKPERPRQ